MAAWVCPECEIKYGEPRIKCDVCSGDLKHERWQAPDSDWKQRRDYLVKTRDEDSGGPILDWRRRQFRRCYPGFTEAELDRLAGSHADLGEARRLARDGCPEGVAFRILA